MNSHCSFKAHCCIPMIRIVCINTYLILLWVEPNFSCPSVSETSTQEASGEVVCSSLLERHLEVEEGYLEA